MTVSSSNFFTAVCGKHYDDLIQMYGNAAIEALQSYQNVQMRWNSRDRNTIQKSSRGTVSSRFSFSNKRCSCHAFEKVPSHTDSKCSFF